MKPVRFILGWLSRLRPGDGLVVLALLVGWRLLVPAPAEIVRGAAHVEIDLPGGPRVVVLEPGEEFAFAGAAGPVRLAWRDDGLSVVQTHCPHRLCAGMGPLARAGGVLCCVPGRWYARLLGGPERPPWDALSR